MRDEPEGLPRSVIAAELGGRWGIDLRGLEYAPVGAGSYHWRAEDSAGRRWFVTADHLPTQGSQDGDDLHAVFAGLQAALETAAALSESGLSFVVGPERNRSGRVVERVLPEWALAVYPLIEGESSGTGHWTDGALQNTAAGLAGQLHDAATPTMIRRWEFAVPHRRVLDEALAELEQTWTGGPYAEPARLLLRDERGRVDAMLKRYEELSAAVAADDEPWVVTHGEMHSANFLSAADGAMYLIDWDTVRLGPRERDLAIVVGDDAAALAAYQAVAGGFVPRSEAVELFGVRWRLADICVYLRRFRQVHDGSEDDVASWAELMQWLTAEPV